MVGYLGQLFKPPQTQLGQDPALVGDLGGQYEVVGTDPVARDHQHPVIGSGQGRVQVTHFSRIDVRPPGYVNERRRERHAQAPAGVAADAAVTGDNGEATAGATTSPCAAFNAMSRRN